MAFYYKVVVTLRKTPTNLGYHSTEPSEAGKLLLYVSSKF